MIQRLEIKNYKVFREAAIDFERLTVLVGANGSGKTTVLEALHDLALRPWTGSDLAARGWRDLGAFVRRGATELLLHWRNADGSEKTIAWERTPSGSGFTETSQRPSLNPDLAVDREDSLPTSTALVRLDPTKLAAPSFSEESVPVLKDDGEGIASVLAVMAGNEPDRFQEIQEALRNLIPTFQRIRFSRQIAHKLVPINDPLESPQAGRSMALGQASHSVAFGAERSFTDYLTRYMQRAVMTDELVFDMQGASDLSARFVSEGTLLCLGLLTILHGKARPRLVLIDDLDRGLHPKAQRRWIELLRKQQELAPELQIVATTHSPYLLHSLEPEEVRCTALHPDGSACCAPLAHHTEFPRWRDEMSPGELWSMFGESWVTQERIQQEPAHASQVCDGL